MFTLTKMTKLFVTTALLFSASFVYASEKTADSSEGPSSNVAWDIKEIRFVRNGDPKKGEVLNKTMLCVTCHGAKGLSVGRNWPHLAGQQANYTFKMLKDYKDENVELSANHASTFEQLLQSEIHQEKPKKRRKKIVSK